MEGLKYFSKSLEGDKVEVYCHNWKGIKYHTIVDDFIKCQKPNTFLLANSCRGFILDSIEDFYSEYNQTEDKVILNLTCVKNKCIEIVLEREQTGEADHKDQIQQLELRVGKLEHFDIVHVSDYPKWKTLDEFMKLPEFKYIDAAYNYRKYLKTDKEGSEEYCYMGEYLNTKIKYIYGCNTGNYIKLDDWVFIRDPNNIGLNSKYVWYDDFYPADRELLSNYKQCAELKETNKFKYRYIKSVESITPGEIPRINSYVLDYIFHYITGWVLIHHASIAMKNIYLDIYIDAGRCTFVLKTSKYKSIPHTKGLNYNCYPLMINRAMVNGFNLSS